MSKKSIPLTSNPLYFKLLQDHGKMTVEEIYNTHQGLLTTEEKETMKSIWLCSTSGNYQQRKVLRSIVKKICRRLIKQNDKQMGEMK